MNPLTNYAIPRTIIPSRIQLNITESNYARVARLDAEIKKLPSGEGKCPITHHFARQAKMYAREMFIPKGMILTSRIHKYETISFLLKGEISVLMPNGRTKRMKAPQTIVSPAGTQRAGYTHEDTVWTSVFHTDETDPEGIEDVLCTKTYPEYLRFLKVTQDYQCFLDERGLSEQMVRALVEDMSDHIDVVELFTEVRPSEIQGKGIFAKVDISKNQIIGLAKTSGKRTIYGRRTNHSPWPNCIFVKDGENLTMQAIEDIPKGIELTVNYRSHTEENVGYKLCHRP